MPASSSARARLVYVVVIELRIPSLDRARSFRSRLRLDIALIRSYRMCRMAPIAGIQPLLSRKWMQPQMFDVYGVGEYPFGLLT